MTVNVANHPPVAVDDIYETNQGSITFSVAISSILSNDYDPDNEEVELASTNPITCPTGYCESMTGTPQIEGSNILVTFTAESATTCQSTKFRYKIQTKDSPAFTAEADVTIRFINCQCNDPLDVIFVLDGSGSISSSNWVVLKSFTQGLIEKFTIESGKVQAGIIQFGGSTRIEHELSYNKASLKDKAGDMDHMNSWTGTLYGINRATNMFNASSNSGRDSINKVYIVITDGMANRPCDCSSCECGSCSSGWASCRWRPSNGRFCMPCADPVPTTNLINKMKKADGWKASWKVYALGIGQDLYAYDERGWNTVKAMNYDPPNTKLVDWDELDSIAQTVVDEGCNSN
jgi:hypothetical protein